MAVEDNLQITTFEQLATLLSQVAQNNTNLSLTYFNMFYNTTPQDITLRLYNTDGVLQEFTVPNRAKDFNYIKNGSGSPQGVITANVGTLYQDTLNGTLYIKSVGNDAQGWVEIANNDLIRTGNNNPNGVVTAPQGTLYINVPTSTLYIKSTSTGSNGWIQVNANLSNVANVDLSNINVGASDAAGNKIRSAITGGASTIAGTNLTASKALISNGLGKVDVSTTTDIELEVLHGITASTAELNVLHGITASTTELNYVDGVTSAIQTQLNGKQNTLVSGTNIKTINNENILDSGNVSLATSSDISTAISTLLSAMYPVGSIYIGVTATCPIASLISGSVWTLVSQDRVLQGAGNRGAVGNNLVQKLPQIWGQLYPIVSNGVSSEDWLTKQGAFASSYGSVSGASGSGATGTKYAYRYAYFYAGNASSVYQDGAPVQPDAYTVNIWQRTA